MGLSAFYFVLAQAGQRAFGRAPLQGTCRDKRKKSGYVADAKAAPGGMG